MADEWAEFRVKPTKPAADEWAEFRVAKQPSITDAVTDIPTEVGNAAGEALTNIKGIANRGGQGPIEGLMTTGKAVLGIPQLLISPITGAARSVLGHGLESATHAAGTLINPEVAAKEDRQKNYETAKGDVDRAMSAGAPKRSAPVKPAIPTIGELEEAYRRVRNTPDVKNTTVPIDQVGDVARTAEQELLARGNRPTPGSAPRTFSEIERLKPSGPPELTPQQRLQAEMNWEKIPEQPRVTEATVDDLLAAKRAFGRVAGERKPLPAMGPTEDAAAASNTIPKIDELIESAAPGMVEANKNWSAAQAAKAIDARFEKAKLGAAVSNSGLNIGNKIRQQALQIYNNPAARRGLQDEEVEMLKSLAEGTPTRNAIRWFSNVTGGGGGLGAAVTGDVASRAVGPVGWLLSPVGKIFKSIENKLTTKAADKISEAIRSRSPYGQALERSAEKWNEAQSKFAGDPTPANLARFTISSRNLANTLSISGAKVDPAQLIRGLQGPVESRADDEQPQSVGIRDQ